MKSLKDYSNEINKCSKCGLCQAVCPVYKLTGNECAVSKGKFVMLNGVIKGDLKLNKTINKYIEMCLLCGKCNDFCPSEIDVCEIFQTAKSEYLNNSLKKRFVHWIESEQVFDKSLNFIETMLNLRIQNSHDKTKPEILFFKGCANKINPSNEQIIRKILKTSGYNLSDADFKCCGVPFASDGNLERYEEVVKYNMRIINSSNCEYVLTDCASCEDALKNYPNLNKQIINIGEFCAQKNIKFEFPKKYIVTFHKPCHLKNDAFVNKLLKNCKNIE